jgi:copper chaperone
MTDTQTLRVSIRGMTCGGCVASATRALERTDGVAVERLTLDAPAVLRLSGAADRETVRRAIEAAGFEADFAS